MKDYYKILNVSPRATALEIKNSFRQLAKKYHPDVVSPNDLEASRKFAEINEAHDVLSDEQKRAEYDKERNGGSTYQSAQSSGSYGTQQRTTYQTSQTTQAPPNSSTSAAADEAIKKQAQQVANYCATIAVRSFVGINPNTVANIVKTVQQNMYNNIVKVGSDGKNLGYNYGYRIGYNKGLQEGQTKAASSANAQQTANDRREISRLEADLARANRLVSSYEREIASLNNQVKDLNYQVTDLQSTISSNELLIEDLNDTITDYKGEILTKDDIIDQLRKDKKTDIDDCLSQYALLQSEYQSYKSAVAASEKNHIQTEADLRARMNVSEGKNLALISQVDRLSKQVLEYEEKLQSAQKTINELLNK